MLASWTQVHQALHLAAADEAIERDIIQLCGLKDRMERKAFLPHEVTDMGLARRVIDYRRLVDKITGRLVSDGVASLTKRWDAGSSRSGRMVVSGINDRCVIR